MRCYVYKQQWHHILRKGKKKSQRKAEMKFYLLLNIAVNSITVVGWLAGALLQYICIHFQ